MRPPQRTPRRRTSTAAYPDVDGQPSPVRSDFEKLEPEQVPDIWLDVGRAGLVGRRERAIAELERRVVRRMHQPLDRLDTGSPHLREQCFEDGRGVPVALVGQLDSVTIR